MERRNEKQVGHVARQKRKGKMACEEGILKQNKSIDQTQIYLKMFNAELLSAKSSVRHCCIQEKAEVTVKCWCPTSPFLRGRPGLGEFNACLV